MASVDEDAKGRNWGAPVAFLTTTANDLMRPVHAKAMTVILTAETWDTWLQGDEPAAPVLQRPAPDGLLSIVATGQREDGGAKLMLI